MNDFDSTLDTAVQRGIITAEQRDLLRALRVESRPAEAEAPRGFNWVNVAYGLGALLVLFSGAWFLVRQWEKLGPWGVLGVALAYIAVLVVADRRLRALGFKRAGDLAVMLAVALTALPAWSILSLTGEWPPDNTFNPPWVGQQYMASRWMVLELSVILAALVVLRVRRVPMLMHAISFALFWVWLHSTQLLEIGYYSPIYQRWTMLAGALVIFATAEHIERWQLRQHVEQREGDFAGPFWLVGCIAFAVSYMSIWARADDMWKHLLPLVAAGVILLSLVLRRRALAALGVVGMFGYLVFLADEVFRNSGLFPVVLAALGILMIVGTVWLQRRFPSLVRRFGSPAGRSIPWSNGMAWLPVFFAASMAVIGLADAEEERINRDFRERLHILRQHSGSMRVAPSRPRPPRADSGAQGAGRGARDSGLVTRDSLRTPD
jgi:hypothetical protein